MGADVTVKDQLGTMALHKAVEVGHNDIITCLLDHSPDNFDVNIRATLFDESDPTNFKREDDCSLIHFAAAGEGGIETIQLLIGRGVDPNTRSSLGRSPADVALSYNKVDIIRFFWSTGLRVNIASMLLNAAKEESSTVLRLCAGNGGIPLDAVGPDGRTAASLAAEEGSDMALQFLLCHGASPTNVDSSGLSPLWWVIRNRSTQCLMVFEKLKFHLHKPISRGQPMSYFRLTIPLPPRH
jgi:ankyrin repeat protein